MAALSSADLLSALATLRAGGVIVFPTDTVYGLGCDALQDRAVTRIIKMKKRPLRKSFPLLLSNLEMARSVARAPKGLELFLGVVWAGKVTVVLPARKNVPSTLVARDGTVALRVPGHEWTRKLINDLGRPLIGTSANVSGSRPARSAKEAARVFATSKDKPDLILDGGRLSGKPSRVIRVTSRGITILR